MRGFAAQLACASAALALCAPAHAYKVYSLDGGRSVVRWSSGTVSYEVNRQFVPYMTDDVAIIQEAFDTWSSERCTDLQNRFTGTTDGNTTIFLEGDTDGRNRVVYVSANQWPVSSDGALAVTQSSYTGNQRGWEIAEADIAFNGGVTWSSNPDRRSFDLQSTAAHEIGHVLGMQHSDNPAATMYFSTPPGDESQRVLHNDDEAGICYLYPAGRHTCTNGRTDCPEVVGRNDRGNEVSYGQQGCTDGVCTFGGELGNLGEPGEPCENFADCEVELICITYSGEGLCATECNTNSPRCDSGFECIGFRGVDDGSGACLPEGPADGEFGDPCESSGDCASGLCVGTGDGNAAICTDYCSIRRQDCPTGGVCLGLRGEPEDRGACLPEGNGDPGTACNSLADCPGGRCLQGPDRVFRCREDCSGPGDDGCANGTACTQSDSGFACFEAGDRALGDACSNFWQCRTLICLQNPRTDNYVCSDLCDDGCPAGFSCDGAGGTRGCFPEDEGPEAQCGDDRCSGDETEETCPEDCAEARQSCGDNICEGDETVQSCPADCDDGQAPRNNGANSNNGGDDGGFVAGFVDDGGREEESCTVAPGATSHTFSMLALVCGLSLLYRRRGTPHG
jgi:hypothetical protein